MNEILNFCIKSANGDLKKVHYADLLNFVQEKLKELNSTGNDGTVMEEVAAGSE